MCHFNRKLMQFHNLVMCTAGNAGLHSSPSMPEGTKSLSLEEQRAISNPYLKAKKKKKKKKKAKKKHAEENRVAASLLEDRFSFSAPHFERYRRMMFVGPVRAVGASCCDGASR